jgi:hypothetical protein
MLLSTDPIAQGIAIYAAILSTIATISGISWEIFKWRRSKRIQLRVGASYSNVWAHSLGESISVSERIVRPRHAPARTRHAGFEIHLVNESDFPVWLQGYDLIMANGQLWWGQNFPANRPMIEPHNSFSSTFEYEMRQKQLEGSRIRVRLTDGRNFYTKRFRNVPADVSVSGPGVSLTV